MMAVGKEDKMTKIDPEYKYIGTSFSLCVRSLIQDEIDIAQVIGIESATKITNAYDLERVMKAYEDTYWIENPKNGRLLATEIYYNKIFYQPRLVHNYYILDKERPLWMKAETQLASAPVTDLFYANDPYIKEKKYAKSRS